MGKFKSNLRHNLTIMLVCVMAIFIAMIPVVAAGVTPTGVPNLQGVYAAVVNYKTYDLDGIRTNFDYRYLGFAITNNTTDDEGLVEGYVFGLNTTTVRGARVQGHTRVYNATINKWRNRQNLSLGANTVNVTAEGTLGVYLPRYCEGMATSDTGVIEGDIVELTSGWNALNVTKAGDIEVGAWMWTTEGPIANLFGVVGENSAARFVLFATDIVTEFYDTDDVLTDCGDYARLIRPGQVYTVESAANGTITVLMPFGTEGTIYAYNCTVDGGESVDLTPGGKDVILVEDDLEEDGGWINVVLTTLVTFQWSGRVTGRAGSYRLNGNYNWFSLPDYITLAGTLNAKPVDYSPPG